MSVLAGGITALVVILLLAFALYIVAVVRLPDGERPLPAAYDRFGRTIGRAQNPDFHLNPGEEHRGLPEILPLQPGRPAPRE